MNCTAERIITAGEIEAFAKHLRNEERSASTREYYLRAARRLMDWMNGRGVEKERVIAYKESLKAQGYKTGSINTMIAAMNSFLCFLGCEDCRVKSLKEQPKNCDTEGKELQRKEYERLIETAEARGNMRLALLINTLGATGMRVSELKFITVEAVHRGITVVKMKGKSRDLVLERKLCALLREYAAEQGIESGPVFITKSGRPMDRSNIWREMKSLCEAAGVPPHKVFPHNLRHFFARVFYNLRHNLVMLAEILGHSSINTTRRYILSTVNEYWEQLGQMRMVHSKKKERKKKTAKKAARMR